MKLLIMADGLVGMEISRYVLDEYPADVAAVITVSRNEIHELSSRRGVATLIFESEERLLDQLRDNIDLGLLAWWPRILRQPLLDRPRNGFINTHPSLLPYNRGKHYNFWTLVEQVPFGVTLHAVTPRVDDGDIVAQSPIPYDWTDTGETLYRKAREAMVELFIRAYPSIRRGQFHREPQNDQLASFHHSSEMDRESRLELDRQYTARQLLNLLRARTFAGHPACWFEDQGERYEVRIDIKRSDR